LKVLCCAAALAAVTVPVAQAQTTQWSKKTFLTFSGPVQIPGKTLQAGTYTFQMADLIADRHVLQVLDKDGKSIIATVMTVPDTRHETTAARYPRATSRGRRVKPGRTGSGRPG
jgi:hypothetical protein